MNKETNTGFTPIIDCPHAGFILSKDANDTVYVFSSNYRNSAPYSVAVAGGKLFGLSMSVALDQKDRKMVVIEVPIGPKLMAWLKSPHISNLVESMAP